MDAQDFLAIHASSFLRQCNPVNITTTLTSFLGHGCKLGTQKGTRSYIGCYYPTRLTGPIGTGTQLVGHGHGTPKCRGNAMSLDRWQYRCDHISSRYIPKSCGCITQRSVNCERCCAHCSASRLLPTSPDPYPPQDICQPKIATASSDNV
ncbi:hypothetical protein BC629DRAFT_612794 [Irpex lacteus]|nr:hypothetical protein BC629DRAFT_612794 [Irpex lacteus]